ncbi:hypothetical protein ATE84_1535 [Aquimarina sp. MAR_2010_214]|uniref:hypothetical protein n=1 Tax=Aquimarina sp. MAR_2010_214 TaxID=1250026 RepID=UPI000C702A6B|nr:hypothetical protein [Aquimarina sp. MAR_2010_214]PKV49509.1 hypothetical protein ATE84_1535 [Aquimarina sp. MAR_2010_214]
MKLKNTPTILFCFLSFLAFSQKEIDNNQMNWIKGWTNFDPNQSEYPEPEEVLPNIIDGNSYLRNDVTYLMSGNVYVINNATLTIEEGTIIRCDAKNATSLVITKGSKLIARGSKGLPIVFTSNKAQKSRKSGDWGGIIIAGSGTINSPAVSKTIEGNFLPQYSSYGGTQENELTTMMSYVRIEYAGKKINQSKELNGLSLYALGSNSIINNIMISYSADDSFECFGGSVNMSNLISYKAKDDDYDFTLGYNGELDNILAIRHPYISDISGSYAIEADGYDKKEGFIDIETLSNIHIKNAVLINLSDQSNYKHTKAAISSKNLAKLNLTDIRISGFANVVKFDKTYKSYLDLQKHFLLENSVFNVHSKSVLTQHNSAINTDQLLKYNMYTNHFKSAADLFTDPFDEKKPIFTLKDSENYTVMQ